jgi:light-independent protochlorophyllide reductase subunit B
VVAPLGAGLADLARMPSAWVNIAPYRELGLLGAQYLEEQFGTPALLDAPIGVQGTLRWLRQLVATLNEIGARAGYTGAPIRIPPLTQFSLDGMSAPSGVPWFARTADMETFSSKRAFVFGDATRTVGVTKFLHDELGMQIAGAGTYLKNQASWVREQLVGYLPEDDGSGLGGLLVSDRFQDVAARIEALHPELVCGTQMERHACRKLDLPCMVIAPPTHIENHLLAYRPFLGFDGADVIADEVYTTATLGMEKHLIDLFGDAGLEYATAEETVAEGQADTSTASEPDHTASTPSGSIASSVPIQPIWTTEAQGMLKKIPFFVRGRVQQRIERYASERGIAAITGDVVLEAKETMGG